MTAQKDSFKWGVFRVIYGVNIVVIVVSFKKFLHTPINFPKQKPKCSHHYLLSLSLNPPLKKQKSLKKKTNFSRISLQFRGLILIKVWVLHSWDSFYQEVLSKYISKTPNSKGFPILMGFLLNFKLMINYYWLWLIKCRMLVNWC